MTSAPGTELGQIVISRAANDLLYGEDGKVYIDLFSGGGTVFLGHSNRVIAAAIREQLDKVWITGRLPTRITENARAIVESFFPPSYRLACFYSTGMEAAEFALRVARVTTGRSGVIGFSGCMHGKSMATASLGWENENVFLPHCRRLPYVSERTEDQILQHLTATLEGDQISAVFVEPIQGSAGGYLASPAFFGELARQCSEHGTLLVIDEIFSGFHRTGSAFVHQDLGINPDIVLIGKAMGNGFPVSGVVLDRRHAIDSRMLPFSTFSENPLATSAVAATLQQMKDTDITGRVSRIHSTIAGRLNGLEDAHITVRGKGAMWILTVAPFMDLATIVSHAITRGVALSAAGSNLLRLLPAATIEQDHLEQACAVIRDACFEEAGRHTSPMLPEAGEK